MTQKGSKTKYLFLMQVASGAKPTWDAREALSSTNNTGRTFSGGLGCCKFGSGLGYRDEWVRMGYIYPSKLKSIPMGHLGTANSSGKPAMIHTFAQTASILGLAKSAKRSPDNVGKSRRLRVDFHLPLMEFCDFILLIRSVAPAHSLVSSESQTRRCCGSVA
jgi:hypothetical protein